MVLTGGAWAARERRAAWLELRSGAGWPPPVVAVGLAAAICAVDLWVRLDIAVSALYAVVVILAASLLHRRSIIAIGSICIGLTIIGFVAGHTDGSPAATGRRAIIIVAIGITTYLAARNQAATEKAERALRRSETDLRVLIDAIPIHIWVSGSDGSDAVFNRRRLEYTGPGVDWQGIVHPDERAEHDAVWAAAIRTGGSFQFEQRLLAADGSYRWFLGRAEALRDEQGNIVRWIGINIDIEERRRAEARLRRAEEDLRVIIDTIPIHVWTALPDGSDPYLNRRRIEYSGRDTDFETVVHPEDRPQQLSAWLASVRTGESFENEQRLQAADGSHRWFLSRAEPLRSASGEIIKWIGINIDIEERRQAEARLRRAEEDLRAIIDTIPTHVWTTLPDGSDPYLNRRRIEYSGSDTDFQTIVHPDDRPQEEQAWLTAVRTGGSYENEQRLRAADGSYRWFISRAEPLWGAAGEIVKWIAINIDIDDLKQAQERIRRSEQDLRDAIDTIPTHVWSTLPDGSDIYLNRRRLEYAAPAVGFEAIVHPDDRALHNETWATSIRTGKSWEVECRLHRVDGAYRWFLVRAEPLRDDDGRIVKWFGANTDIDNLRRAEEALQRAQAELAHVTRVATLGELTASIAHEVNQPLAGIVTNGEACLRWLQRERPDLEEAQRAVERIIGDGRRAGQVVRRLRALARKDEPDWHPFDLNEVVEDSLPLIAQEMTRRRIGLELALSPGLPCILGDRVQLQQVVINLIVNGIQAMADVTARPRTLTVSSWLQEANADAAASVMLAVRDSGPGVDPAVGDRLFDAFFTTRPDGMGMGLSICRSIVEAHGGRISVAGRHAPDRGTGAAFQFALPAHAQVHQ